MTARQNICNQITVVKEHGPPNICERGVSVVWEVADGWAAYAGQAPVQDRGIGTCTGGCSNGCISMETGTST